MSKKVTGVEIINAPKLEEPYYDLHLIGNSDEYYVRVDLDRINKELQFVEDAIANQTEMVDLVGFIFDSETMSDVFNKIYVSDQYISNEKFQTYRLFYVDEHGMRFEARAKYESN